MGCCVPPHHLPGQQNSPSGFCDIHLHSENATPANSPGAGTGLQGIKSSILAQCSLSALSFPSSRWERRILSPLLRQSPRSSNAGRYEPERTYLYVRPMSSSFTVVAHPSYPSYRTLSFPTFALVPMVSMGMPQFGVLPRRPIVTQSPTTIRLVFSPNQHPNATSALLLRLGGFSDLLRGPLLFVI